jgi:hypothetical protein
LHCSASAEQTPYSILLLSRIVLESKLSLLPLRLFLGLEGVEGVVGVVYTVLSRLVLSVFELLELSISSALSGLLLSIINSLSVYY